MKESTRADGSQNPLFIRPSTSEHERDERANIFEDVLKNATKIVGITSGVDHRGVNWLEGFLDQSCDPHVLVVLAVFGGCRTQRDDLARLLDLQDRADHDRVRFRILPMEGGSGAPANCLVALRATSTSPVLLVGPTPNFGIGSVDRTQVNLCFEAELELFDQWRRWFDAIWPQATPLTTATIDIPALVPATGTLAAAEKWQTYCDLCAQFVERHDEQVPVNDSEASDVLSVQDDEGSEAPPSTPTTLAELPKLDPLEDRITRLFRAGHQVTIARSSAVRPLVVPINPRLLRQAPEIRDGTVIQRQSFSISAFSENELKRIDTFRRASRTILEKLGLPLARGVYWLPNEAIDIFKREWQSRNEEAHEALNQIVDGNADNFVDRKIDVIRDDLNRVLERLGCPANVTEGTLPEVVSDLKRRISHAIEGQLAAPVTYSEVRFLAREDSAEQAPWAQAEKLVLALAKFPRKVIAHPKRTLAGLTTPDVDILAAMDVENDAILRDWTKKRFESEIRARSEEGMLDRVSNANIASRDRCKATLMLIDGRSLDDVYGFIVEKEQSGTNLESLTQDGDTP